MEDEVKAEIVESEETTTENTEQVKSNLSPEEFISSRYKNEEPKKEVSKSEDTEEESKKSEESEKSKDEQANVPSQVDLDSLSQSELDQLSKKLGSRAVARFGELTAKKKAAEEQLQALQKQMAQRQQRQFSDDEVRKNPYKDIKDPKKLQEKAKELDEVIEWAEDIIFDSDGLMADDVVTTVDGKELTKKDVRAALKNARNSKTKYLPMQIQHLRAEANGVRLKSSFVERARKELSWMNEEDSEVNQKYKSMLNDRRLVSSLSSANPEVKAQLPYLLAHAANSLYARKVLPADKVEKGKVSLDPPKSNTSSAAKPARSNVAQKKANSLRNKFTNSGNTQDFIKLRTQQLSR